MQDKPNPYSDQVDQSAEGIRNQAATEILAAALTGLIARHPKGPIDPKILAEDAVAITQAAIREMMLAKLL